MSDSSRFDMNIMIEGLICVVLSSVLSNVTLLSLPHGGSVDLELVPLMIFAWRRGVARGCAAGALYGLVVILKGGYIASPLQALTDYPIAYGTIGLVAMFPNLAQGHVVGVIMAAFGNILCRVVTGALNYMRYAPTGANAWAYSVSFHTPAIVLKYSVAAIAASFVLMILSVVLPIAVSKGIISAPAAPSSSN